MTVAALSAAVQVRVSPDRLKQLTNYDPSAVTTNTTVLEAACGDAIGEFENISGIAHDTNNVSHLAILIKGVQYFLESYKGRDSGMMQNFAKSFQIDCAKLRERAYISPQTNSKLVPIAERANQRPDMDRSLKVWVQNQQSGSTPSEIASENE